MEVVHTFLLFSDFWFGSFTPLPSAGSSPNLKTFQEPKNQFQETNSARLCCLAGRYDNPIPTCFLAPLDCIIIPAQVSVPGTGGRRALEKKR